MFKKYITLIAILCSGCAILNVTHRDYLPPPEGNAAKIRFVTNVDLAVEAIDCGGDERAVKLARIFSDFLFGTRLNYGLSLNMPLKPDHKALKQTELLIPAGEPYGLFLYRVPEVDSMFSVGGGIYATYDTSASCYFGMMVTPKKGALYELAVIARRSPDSSQIVCSNKLTEIVESAPGSFIRKDITPEKFIDLEKEPETTYRQFTCEK